MPAAAATNEGIHAATIAITTLRKTLVLSHFGLLLEFSMGMVILA
jgi:hypothetical protein